MNSSPGVLTNTSRNTSPRKAIHLHIPNSNLFLPNTLQHSHLEEIHMSISFTEANHFIRRINENLLDPAPRQAYADWLEEQGAMKAAARQRRNVNILFSAVASKFQRIARKRDGRVIYENPSIYLIIRTQDEKAYFIRKDGTIKQTHRFFYSICQSIETPVTRN